MAEMCLAVQGPEGPAGEERGCLGGRGGGDEGRRMVPVTFRFGRGGRLRLEYEIVTPPESQRRTPSDSLYGWLPMCTRATYQETGMEVQWMAVRPSHSLGYRVYLRVEFLSAQPPVLLADSGKMDEVVVSSHFE
jgi:hypothetical protein